MSEKEIAEMYNKMASHWYKLRIKKKVMNELLDMPAMLSLLTKIKGKKVLDLGCGPGIYSKILKSRGAKVWGIDLSEREIEIAKVHANGVDFKVGNAYDLPYKSGFFDIVVSALVVDHFKTPRVAFSEVRRVLKDGGTFLFSIYNPVVNASRHIKGRPRNYRRFENYFDEGERHSRWFRKTRSEVNMPYYHRTYQTWIGTIVKSGFMITDYIDTKLPPTRPHGVTKKQYDSYRFTLKMPHVAIFKVSAI